MNRAIPSISYLNVSYEDDLRLQDLSVACRSRCGLRAYIHYGSEKGERGLHAALDLSTAM